MKKITLWLTFLVAFVTGSYGQTVSTYGFSQTTGTYTEITGGTLLGTTTSDDQRFVDPAVPAGGTVSTGVGFPIGFNFTYNNVVFDRVAVNNNGWICLGQSALSPSVNIASTSAYTPLTSTTVITPADLRSRIAGFGEDLQGQTGSELRIETIGIAPNQTLVVQWKGYREFGSAGHSFNFQIRLNETTNIIDVVYGTMTFNATSDTSQVGLGGNVSTDFNNRATTTNWNTTTAGGTNNASCTYSTTVTAPVSGTTFTWTPPVICTGTPTAGTVAPATQSICSGVVPANFVASGYTSGVTGLTFQWEESDDDGVADPWAAVTGGTGATTATYTPQAFTGTTIYYRLNVTCTPSGFSAQTASVSVNPAGNPSTQATNLAQGTAALTSIPLTWTNGNGGRRIVIFNNTNSFTDPINGNAPAITASAAYAGTGEQIVYDGTGAAVTVTGLTGSTTYYAKVYEYLRCGAGPYDYYYNVAVGTNVATVVTASPPVNDNFANASVATCGGTYTGSTSLATLDEDSAPDGFGADMDSPNVWYSFTGTGPAETVTLDLCASSYDSSVLVYTGTSGALTLIAGNDDDASCSNGTRSKVTFTSDGTTTYYIAVEGYNSTSVGAYSMIVSCVAACSPAVTNQACASALAVLVDGINVNSDNSCGDASAAQPSCDTFGTVQDVWFSFVAPGSGNVDVTFTLGTMTSGNFTVLEGACGATTEIAGTCNSNITSTTPVVEVLTGLTAGNTYFVQVWSSGAEQGTFSLALSQACAVPTGINAANITTSGADLSWTPTSGNYEYVLDQVNTDPAGAGTTLAGETYNATLLAENTTYYFHIRTDCGGGLFSVWTTYSFTTLAPAPANDDCAGAIVLTVAADYATGNILTSKLGATASEVVDPSIPAPGCASYVGGDVWFSAVVPASGTITFETAEEPGSFTDGGLAVYNGACGALALVNCDDDLGVGNFSLLALTGTPGETLYARVWRFGNAGSRDIMAAGDFRIAAYDASLSTNSFDMNGFKAYPNPVKNMFKVSYVKEISSISVHNLVGQEVMTKKVNALNSDVDMSALASGTYLVKVTSEGLTKTIKVIKE